MKWKNRSLNRYAIKLQIFGHVQAVGYRNWLVMEAKKHNLNGWVKNYDDLSVGVLLEGDIDDINETIKNCYQGPWNARVKKIVKKDLLPDELVGFVIKDESIIPGTV